MANEYTSSVGTTDDGGLKGKAQHALSNVQERAGEKLETTITDQKTRAADRLSGVAQSLMTSSQQLRTDGNEDVSRYIERAANQVDRLAGYLQRADVHEVVDQVEDFARRQPAAFMAGAFAVGFLASRFLKSSRNELGYNRNFSDGRSRAFEAGGNFETSRGYTSAARTLRYDESANWRNTGYSAVPNTPNRDIVGDPSARTSVGLETGASERNSTNRDIVGDPSVRTSVGLETSDERNRGDAE